MRRCTWMLLVLVASLGFSPARRAEAALNNGFETDWVYVTRDLGQGGQLRAFRESDGVQMQELCAGCNYETLTFAGTGSNDARLFVAKVNGNDIQIDEVNASGGVVASANLSAIIGEAVGTGPLLGGLRYHALTNTLFLGVNRNPAVDNPATVYEFNLGLSTRIHTYIGPTLPGADPRNANIALNSRNGTLYLISRGLGGTVAQGNLVSFVTAGRSVGGTTSTFTTLINGVTYGGVNSQYTQPHTVIFRQRAGSGSDDTILIPTQFDAGARPVLEFWLDTTAHPSGNPAYLALRGTAINVPRGWNGQQDGVTGHVWLGALRGGFHVVRADDSTATYEGSRNWTDAGSPFSPAPVAPVIDEVTPDPQIVGTGSEYTRQLSLLQGTPPITWSVVQGPPGTVVNGSGLVSGWTPGPGDAGGDFTFEIRAQNAQGQDTESWQVHVSAANNGFILDYLYSTRADAAQLRIHRKVDGVAVGDLVTNTTWTTLTFSGVGQNDDARLFVAQPTPSNTDVQIAELNSNGQTVHSALLSTIIGGPVGPAITLSNIRYSSFHNSLFIGLNPNISGASNGTAYEIDLGLSTRIHTYVGGIMSTTVRGAGVDINARDGTLYMTGQHLGEPSETGFGDVIAFNTAGRTVGGTTSAFTVLIDGPTQNASNILYNQPSCPIYRKRPSGDDILVVLTNASASSSPVLEYYLNTVAHPVDQNGNLAYRGNPLGIPRGWNGQQDIGTLNVWMAGLRGGIHALRDDDTVGSFDTGRWWSDTDAPPFRSCNEPFADADADTDVDHDDFSAFQICYTGPSGGVPVGCACFDRQRDGDVDNFDFNAFSDCRTGPNVPWTPGLTPNCSP